MRFLIVDDDESVHLYLQAVLASYGTFVTAMSGEEAVDRYSLALKEGHPFDVVMMDIVMPGMDGHKASEIMRAREKAASIAESDRFKLVMITGLVDKVNVDKAFSDSGADSYIVKPLDKDKIIIELKGKRII
ncbi:response regulator [Pseudodesulfovibrio sp. S3]|nr:response regulator [Pseudodesulfovibrio sp. S3]